MAKARSSVASNPHAFTSSTTTDAVPGPSTVTTAMEKNEDPDDPSVVHIVYCIKIKNKKKKTHKVLIYSSVCKYVCMYV